MAPASGVSDKRIEFFTTNPNNYSITSASADIFDPKIDPPKTSLKTNISATLAGQNPYNNDYNSKLTIIDPRNINPSDNSNIKLTTMVKGYFYTLSHKNGIDDEDRSFKKLPHDVQKYIKLKASECGAKSMA